MGFAFTENYARLFSGPEGPVTVGMWVKPCYRANHIYERVMTTGPMTLRSMARAVGLDIAALDEAWRVRRERYPMHDGNDELPTDALAVERYQLFLIDALGVLEDYERPFAANSRGLRGEAVLGPAFQQLSEQAILQVLHEQPEGMADIIAACMVVMAAMPEEIDEAARSRLVRVRETAGPIREVVRTTHEVVEIWHLPPARRRRVLREVELLVVRLQIPVIDNPQRPERSSVVAANEGQRGDGYGHITVLGGPRGGEQLGSFRCTGRNYPAETGRAIEQLWRSGSLRRINVTDESAGRGRHS